MAAFKVAITYLSGPRIPHDVIKTVAYPCNNYDHGIQIASEYIRSKPNPVPDDTMHIKVDIWANG